MTVITESIVSHNGWCLELSIIAMPCCVGLVILVKHILSSSLSCCCVGPII